MYKQFFQLITIDSLSQQSLEKVIMIVLCFRKRKCLIYLICVHYLEFVVNVPVVQFFVQNQEHWIYIKKQNSLKTGSHSWTSRSFHTDNSVLISILQYFSTQLNLI